MPRPIPPNPASITGYRYFLVAMPDDDTAIAAGWDAFSALMNAWEWGLEGITADSETMAQVWADAVFETGRIRDMGFPDALLAYIDEVETLLRELKTAQQVTINCCDNLGPISDTVGTAIIPDDGTPPTTWGEEPVADWQEWHDLVCGAAHAYVDHLKGMARQVDTMLTVGTIAIGAIAGILGLLSGAGIILAIEYGLAASVVTGLADAIGSLVFSNAEDDIEAARDDLVCAVFDGPSAIASTIQSAIDTTAWSLFFQFIDYESAQAVLFEGGDGTDVLEVNPRTDCNCFDYTFFAEWILDGTDAALPKTASDFGYPNTSVCGEGVELIGGEDTSMLYLDIKLAADKAGHTLPGGIETFDHYLARIEVDYACSDGGQPTGYVEVETSPDPTASLLQSTPTAIPGTHGTSEWANVQLYDASYTGYRGTVRIRRQKNGCEANECYTGVSAVRTWWRVEV